MNILCVVASVLVACTTSVSEPWYTFGEYEYTFPSGFVRGYNQVLNHCAGLDATLVVVKSRDVRDFLLERIGNLTSAPFSYYIGLTRTGPRNSDFVWEDGTSITSGSTWWYLNEPNNANEAHSIMGWIYELDYEFPWYDIDDKKPSRIICQKLIPTTTAVPARTTEPFTSTAASMIETSSLDDLSTLKITQQAAFNVSMSTMDSRLATTEIQLTTTTNDLTTAADNHVSTKVDDTTASDNKSTITDYSQSTTSDQTKTTNDQSASTGGDYASSTDSITVNVVTATESKYESTTAGETFVSSDEGVLSSERKLTTSADNLITKTHVQSAYTVLNSYTTVAVTTISDDESSDQSLGTDPTGSGGGGGTYRNLNSFATSLSSNVTAKLQTSKRNDVSTEQTLSSTQLMHTQANTSRHPTTASQLLTPGGTSEDPVINTTSETTPGFLATNHTTSLSTTLAPTARGSEESGLLANVPAEAIASALLFLLVCVLAVWLVVRLKKRKVTSWSYDLKTGDCSLDGNKENIPTHVTTSFAGVELGHMDDIDL